MGLFYNKAMLKSLAGLQPPTTWRYPGTALAWLAVCVNSGTAEAEFTEWCSRRMTAAARAPARAAAIFHA